MKMMYGGVPIESLNIRHYEMNTNDCTMVPSDLQSGVTAVARGKKIVGTGKSFEFASYGDFLTNEIDYVPSDINVILISSMNYPIQHTLALKEMKYKDFSTPLEVGRVVIDNDYYPIYVEVNNNLISIICEKSISIEVFYGKDNYV